MNSNLLEVKNLSVSFFTPSGEVKAVNNISYKLDKSKVLGIVGESGSGKSVSAYSIMGLIEEPGKIINGEIFFEGKDLIKLSEHEKRKIRGDAISMIFQDPMTCLNPVYTIGNQLTEALTTHQKISKTAAINKIIELLNLVGINEPKRRMGQYPHELSGGMRQRVMIAMALAGNPQILIADEPTTALDVTIQAQILELIKDIQKKIQMAVILITHDFGIVADMADDIIVMYGGGIVERGTVFDIFERPKHPYTLGLLKSLPRIDIKQDRLIPIEGTPIDLLNMKTGCPFSTRCEECMKVCIENKPPIVQFEEGHFSACWLHKMPK